MSESPRILVFQHVACEHPGVFRDFMAADGIAWDAVELDEGQPIPALEPYAALLVMGGPMDVWQTDAHPWLAHEMEAIRRWVQDLQRPYLGVCLGHQLLAEALGGRVGPATTPEVGLLPIELTAAGRSSPLFAGVAPVSTTLQWHSAEVLDVPPGGTVLAASPACRVQSLAVGGRAFGVQYHLEITPKTVAEWGAIPEYSAALDKALGPDALPELDRRTAEALPAMTAIARQVWRNFAGLLRGRC